jgi:hypothetical protein
VNMTSLLENLFSPLSHLLYLRPMIFAWWGADKKF